jgi:hypothetical protein
MYGIICHHRLAIDFRADLLQKLVGAHKKHLTDVGLEPNKLR